MSVRRISVALALVMGVVVAYGAPAAKQAAKAKAGEARRVYKGKPTWSDEFNGSRLDEKRWNRCKKGNADWCKHMSGRSDLVQVKGGSLVMWGVANKDTKSDPRPFLTGGVDSRGKGSMTYGKVEMRVKFEDHQKGAWPALWMMPDAPDPETRGWPWCGEIDIVERLNSDSFVYHTVHSGWTNVKKHAGDPQRGGKGSFKKGGWNIYALEKTEDCLIWSVNGTETFRYERKKGGDPDQWPFNKPFYFILDMQLGGNWVGKVDISTLPVKMYVDWIRVYELEKPRK